MTKVSIALILIVLSGIWLSMIGCHKTDNNYYSGTSIFRPGGDVEVGCQDKGEEKECGNKGDKHGNN